MSEELAKKQESTLATQSEAPMGYEDGNEGDLIVPRVKVVQLLSPEFKEKVADEGDIINSLTKEKHNGQVFVPVFIFNNNIWWKPRSEGGGINCIARDGKLGIRSDNQQLICAKCRLNEFDNTKQGREAQPKCTKYINFFGFFRDQYMPIILSFSKTNYAEGRKMFSLAKVTMQNMWHNGYVLNEKKMAKGGNEWFVINPTAAGPTSEEERAFGLQLYHSFRAKDLNFDMEEAVSSEPGPSMSGESVESAEF